MPTLVMSDQHAHRGGDRRWEAYGYAASKPGRAWHLTPATSRTSTGSGNAVERLRERQNWEWRAKAYGLESPFDVFTGRSPIQPHRRGRSDHDSIADHRSRRRAVLAGSITAIVRETSRQQAVGPLRPPTRVQTGTASQWPDPFWSNACSIGLTKPSQPRPAKDDHQAVPRSTALGYTSELQCEPQPELFDVLGDLLRVFAIDCMGRVRVHSHLPGTKCAFADCSCGSGIVHARLSSKDGQNRQR